MSLHKLSAGDGYTYLTRQVAASDSTELGRVALADYYSEKGERPGAWLGAGLVGVGGVEAGQVVSEAQMRALFGEGRHPNADAIQASVIAAGGTAEDALAASALGARFRQYANEPSDFVVNVTRRYAEWNEDHGRAKTAAVPEGERSRIRSEVGRETFLEAYGREPLGERELSGHIARSSRPGRQAVAGYDLSFSPVKSVSTLWALADPETARLVEAAHDAAVADTIAWVEREVAYTREGANGIRQIEVTGLIAAAFTHRDSRAGDPDLHTHVAVSNKVQAADGRWLALDGTVLHRAVVAASERYNTRLEQEVSDRLGVAFTIARSRDGVREREGKRAVREITGIPTELMAAWSTRRAAIDVARADLARQFQADHGRPPTPKEAVELAQQATLATRDPKHEPRSLGEQRAAWRAQAEAVLGGTEAVDAMLTGVTAGAPRPARQDLGGQQVLDLAARALYTVQMHRARFGWTHIYAEASRLVRGLGVPAARLDGVVDTVVARALGSAVAIIPADMGAEQVEVPEAVRRSDGASVYQAAKSQLYTTTRVLDAEAYLVRIAGESGGRTVDETTLDLALLESAANGVTLNPGQAQLVTEMLTSGARLQLALAPAGSGKTTAMAVLTRAWVDSGGQVIGLAPSAAAAEQLADATGASAETLAKLTHSLREDVEAPAWVTGIGPRSLVVIDEAGMAGTLELAKAVRYVTSRGGSVRLVGDDQQLAAISAGGVLRDIAEEVGAVTLSSLMRFADPAEAAATLALRAGDPQALGFYLDRGRVHVADEATVTDLAYAAWKADTDAGLSSLMLAYSNDDVAELNARARADRLAAEGAAPGIEVLLASGLPAGTGDVIVTRRNERRLALTATDWVKNGDRFTVTAAHPGGSLSVRHAATRRTITLPADYVSEWVDLGYASTFHGAQGASVDTCHAALSGAENRQLFYVGMTRGADQNHAYISTGGDGDAHGMIRPERIAPPTAAEAIAGIIARDGSQRSATTETREQHAPQTRLGLDAPRYLDALGVAAVAMLGDEGAAELDARSEAAVPGVTCEPAWAALRGELALIALGAADPVEAGVGALTAAAASRELDTALDTAAVLHWRLTDRAAGPAGPLPWLPGTPAALRDDEQWAPYLAERSRLVTEAAGELRARAHEMRPGQVPVWARPILSDRDLLADVMTWRTATGVTDANDDGLPAGSPHPAARPRRYQQRLETRIAALTGARGPAGQRWRRHVGSIDPRVLADPYWSVLDRRLDLAAGEGLDVPGMLAEAGAEGALPDEHPAAALWYRLATAISDAGGSMGTDPAPGPTPPAPGDVEPGLDPDTRPEDDIDAEEADLAEDEADLAAVESVAAEAGPVTPAQRILDLNAAAMDYYRQQYTGSGANGYLAGRLGQDPSVGGRFAVGYAPAGWTALTDHLREHAGASDTELVEAGLAKYSRRDSTIDLFRDRLMFGIHNRDGELVGFTGRAAPGETNERAPKYMNTPETAVFTKGALLFGAAEAADLLRDGATPVRVEGPLDAIAVTLAGAGRRVGLAPLGTALTEAQAEQLTEPGGPVLVATDSDQAGRKAADADYWKLTGLGADTRALPLAGAGDPAEMYAADPAALAEALADADQAPSLAQSLIDARIAANADGLAKQWNVETRLWVARTCGQVIAALPPEQWDQQVSYAAERIGQDRDPWHSWLVYRETLAAAVDWNPDTGTPDAAAYGRAIVRLDELSQQLQRAEDTAPTADARAEAVVSIAEGMRDPAAHADEERPAAVLVAENSIALTSMATRLAAIDAATARAAASVASVDSERPAKPADAATDEQARRAERARARKAEDARREARKRDERGPAPTATRGPSMH